MAKNEMKMLARMTFVADKMVQNMKKCLEKKARLGVFKQHPAIEPETGLMVATNGHVLAAHKLQDYHCELGDGVFVVNGARMVPEEVTKMKGMVTVEILSDGHDEVVRVTDGQGNAAELKQDARYPHWRSVMPWNSGYPIAVDAKAWDAVLKDMLSNIDKSMVNCPMRVYGERDSKTIRLSHYNPDTDEEWKRDVQVGWMPYKMFASFNCKRLRDIMAFLPTAMRFEESTRAVMFTSDDTLMLLMPLISSDDFDLTCKIEQKDYDRFDLAKWMMAKPQEVKKPKAKAAKAVVQAAPQPEPSPAERLRMAMLAFMKQAA